MPVHVGKAKTPWAALQTKRPDALYLDLFGPKNRFPTGRLAKLGYDFELDTERPEYDVIRLRFRTRTDLGRGNLAALLKEHLEAVKTTQG